MNARAVWGLLTSRLVRVAIAVGLLAFLLTRIDLVATLGTLRRISPWLLAAQLAAFYAVQALVSLRWKWLLKLNGISISWWRAMRLNFLGLFTSCFLPGSVGGDAVKIAVLAREGHGAGRTITAVVLDRLINTTVVTLCACAMLPRILGLVKFARPALPAHGLLWGGMLAVVGAGGLILMLRLLPVLARRGIIPTGAWERIARARDELLAWRDHPLVFAKAVLITFGMLLIATAAAYLLLVGLHAPIRYVDYLSVFFAMHFVNMLPISINGLGVTEVSLVVLLGTLGVDRETAAGFAILSRALYYLAVAPGACIGFRPKGE